MHAIFPGKGKKNTESSTNLSHCQLLIRGKVSAVFSPLKLLPHASYSPDVAPNCVPNWIICNVESNHFLQQIISHLHSLCIRMFACMCCMISVPTIRGRLYVIFCWLIYLFIHWQRHLTNSDLSSLKVVIDKAFPTKCPVSFILYYTYPLLAYFSEHR